MAKTICILQADDAVRDVMQFILEDNGYLAAIGHPQQLVTQVSRQKPDLIILDLWPIGAEQILFLQQFRSSPEAVPVLGTSTEAVRSPEVMAVIDGFLPQPFDMEELLEKVKQLLSSVSSAF